MSTRKPVIYRDDKNSLILLEVDGKIVTKFSLSDWSYALVHPRKIDSESFDFSREPA